MEYINGNGDLVEITDFELKEVIENYYDLKRFNVRIGGYRDFFVISISKSVLKTKEVKKLFLDSYQVTFEEDTGEFIFSIKYKKIFKKILKNLK